MVKQREVRVRGHTADYAQAGTSSRARSVEEAAARAQAGPPPGNAGAVLLATVSPRCILSMSYLEGNFHI